MLRRKLYSPQIREDLIPIIYRVAKSESVAMTTWVNRAVEEVLVLREQSRKDEQGKVIELVEAVEAPLANIQ